MRNRVSVLALWAVCAGVAIMAMVHFGDGQDRMVRRTPSCNRSPAGGAIVDQDRLNHRYGKIELPAELFINLGQGDSVADSLTIRATVSSLVPVDSGVLTLMVPDIGTEPNHTEVLWAGTPADFVSETSVYKMDALPVGQYCFTVAFEFTPRGADADTIGISQSLYIDVRDTGILSSNVSFEQIRRLELRGELERRILASLKPRLRLASNQAIDDELARLEAADPGFLDRKIAELKATDPDVARKILELNERLAEVHEETVGAGESK